jgi:hypothetical protein
MKSGESAFDPGKCPLCGAANHCQLCTADAYKGPCWCARVQIPDELLAQVPAELKNRACICQTCVTNFHRHRSTPRADLKILPGDFYFDLGGRMVFTAEYHLRRGYCCGNGCRHCPYQ